MTARADHVRVDTHHRHVGAGFPQPAAPQIGMVMTIDSDRWERRCPTMKATPPLIAGAAATTIDDHDLAWHGRETYSDEYRAALRSPHWRQLRQAIIEASGSRCIFCKRPGAGDLHHLTYARLGRELPEDVIGPLHRPCHTNLHSVLQYVAAVDSYSITRWGPPPYTLSWPQRRAIFDAWLRRRELARHSITRRSSWLS